MKRVRYLLYLPAFLTILVWANGALACSCETYGQPRKDAQEYYRKKFDGAIFTGTIKEIKNDPAAAAGGITFSELRIDVDQYWLGVAKPNVAVFVYGPDTSCWADWKAEEKAFFIASNHDGRLYYSVCEVVNWVGSYPDSDWSDYTRKVLGPPKSFLKNKVLITKKDR